jgi:type I restriction enzyme R subunit
MEAWLDQGRGACLLRQPRIREIVCGALHHFNGARYALASYVVMPNHVHVVFQPMGNCLIEDIVHSWKSYTSKEIQKLTQQSGALWQRGYWDRLMRSQVHLDRCIRYIEENPSDAGLKSTDYTLYRSSKG